MPLRTNARLEPELAWNAAELEVAPLLRPARLVPLLKVAENLLHAIPCGSYPGASFFVSV